MQHGAMHRMVLRTGRCYAQDGAPHRTVLRTGPCYAGDNLSSMLKQRTCHGLVWHGRCPQRTLVPGTECCSKCTPIIKTERCAQRTPVLKSERRSQRTAVLESERCSQCTPVLETERCSRCALPDQMLHELLCATQWHSGPRDSGLANRDPEHEGCGRSRAPPSHTHTSSCVTSTRSAMSTMACCITPARPKGSLP